MKSVMKRLYHFEHEGQKDSNEEEEEDGESNENSMNNRAELDDEIEEGMFEGPGMGKEKRKQSLVTTVIEQFMRVLG